MIEPGWEGSADDETLRVRAVLVPQLLSATTDIVPPVAPGITVIDVDVEPPSKLQPDGRVQL